MALRGEPTARQLRLAVELRRLRDAAGLSAKEAAAQLGVSGPVISQIEAGIAGVSEKRLRRLAANYSCTDPALVDALVAVATDRTRGWWEKYRGLLPAPFLDLSELNHHASFRRDVAILYVPGLFQTEAYAHAVFSARVPELTPDEREMRVRHRLEGQRITTPYELVIHESALRIRVSDRAAARAQLAKLLECSEADNVTMRVVPLDLDGFAGASGSMTYVGGPLPKLDTVVRDAPHGSVFIDSEAQLKAYRARFRKVEAASLGPDRSRDLIHELTKEL